MNLTIVTTYFDLQGSGAYLPMLSRWLLACERAVPAARVIVFSDAPAPRDRRFDFPWIARPRAAEEYRDVIREGEGVDLRCTAFDLKGALLCEALQHFGAFLYLDLDALPVADPTMLLRGFAACPIAMPADQGARRATGAGFASHLSPPFHAVAKHNAGVMWFGGPNQRERLVSDYRAAWQELRRIHEGPAAPEKRALLEQSAWSLVLHQRLRDATPSATLPDTMNWPVDHLGADPMALIHHYAGGRKWRSGFAQSATAAA